MPSSTSTGDRHPDTIKQASAAVDAAVEDLYAAVKQAREDGESWASIGGALGVTKQAAQERFGGRRRAPRTPRPPKPPSLR